MTTLLVSPFAPYRDGIAAYAMQELRALRSEGVEVEVLSPLPSAAHHHLPLGAIWGWVALMGMARKYDRVIIQFAPAALLTSGYGGRFILWPALALITQLSKVDLRIHELDYPKIVNSVILKRLLKSVLKGACRVTVHTETERLQLAKASGVSLEKLEVIDHGKYFSTATRIDKSEARRRLKLDPVQFNFVSIGFLQHHKGFDRAIEAIRLVLRQAPQVDAHLHIVGSPRLDHPEISSYVEELRKLCGSHQMVTLHERYVSDVEFDLWMQAADVLVVPYREIWSSGVLERAKMFGLAVIASNLAQLKDQAPIGTFFFDSTAELALAMIETYRQARSDSPQDTSLEIAPGAVDIPNWPPIEDGVDAIQAEINSRARSETIGCSPDEFEVGILQSREQLLAELLSLDQLERPQPNSNRPGVARLKRAIQMATNWQMDPLIKQVDALQQATIKAVSALDTAIGDQQQNDTHEPPLVQRVDLAERERSRS